MKTPYFLLPLVALPLFGAAPFTTEEFNTSINTSRWFIYDYETRTFDSPDWNAVDGGANPEASTTFTVGNGVSFVANESSSLGTFFGDFLSAGINGIDCDIYAENAALIQSVEFFILHDEVFYFSDPFTLNDDGWSILQYSLTAEPWYYIDSEGFFVDAVITDDILSDIDQIGVDFFPVTGVSAIGSRVAIDNFTLMGHVPSTPLSIEGGSDIAVSFQQEDGFSYTIQTVDHLPANNWGNLSPETTNLSGTESFRATIARSARQFLRLITRPIYYAVPDIGA